MYHRSCYAELTHPVALKHIQASATDDSVGSESPALSDPAFKTLAAGVEVKVIHGTDMSASVKAIWIFKSKKVDHQPGASEMKS